MIAKISWSFGLFSEYNSIHHFTLREQSVVRHFEALNFTPDYPSESIYVIWV